MATVSGGELVVRTLAAQGIDTVFGLIGVHALPIYDALFAHPEVRHIAVRHEQSAAYLADGYARVSGRPGVCITTTGPGAANTAAAMGTAYHDSVPVVNVMTQVPSDVVDKQKGFLHEAKDQFGLFRALTKWNARVERPHEIPAILRRALREASEGRPRPVQVEICTDMLSATVEESVVDREMPVSLRKQERVESGKLEAAAELLAKAQRPVIWAGGGVNRAGAARELMKLAGILQAPVVTTLQGAGAVPYDHPLALGYRPFDRTVSDIIAQGDLLLAVGTRFTAMQTAAWKLKLPPRLIHIDADAEEIGRNYPATVGLVGDAREVLLRLTDRLGGVRRSECWAGNVAETRAGMAAGLKERSPLEMGLIETLRSALGRDAVVVCDQTKLAYWAARVFPVFLPNTLLYPGYGTLGYGLPAALGAKVAAPDRQVLCICGDGGFQMTLPELATAVQFGINVTVLLLNDNAYGILRDMQDAGYEGRHSAVDLVNPDFPRLVEAYGLPCISLESEEGLPAVLEEALAAGRTTVIEMKMDVGRPRA